MFLIKEEVASMTSEVFRTFWHGPRLTWIGRLCLSSFLARGHSIELFSYEPVDGVPSGVVIRDAAEILPCEKPFLYQGGHAEISASSLHSNVFRYKLLHDLGGWWIDADVLRLEGEIPKQVPLFGRENFAEEVSPGSPGEKRFGCGTAVMRFRAGAEIMGRAYAEAAAMASENPSWGMTGPYLFTRLIEELGLGHCALPESMVYAINYTEVEKLVRTECREELERRTDGAPFIHLFHHGLKFLGHSDELPPEGSFLGSRYKSSCQLNRPG
jgi:hypothetical protein